MYKKKKNVGFYSDVNTVDTPYYTHCGSLHIQKLPLQYLYSHLIKYVKLFTSLKHFDKMMNITLIIISKL